MHTYAYTYTCTGGALELLLDQSRVSFVAKMNEMFQLASRKGHSLVLKQLLKVRT
jgi:hypothetical protein